MSETEKIEITTEYIKLDQFLKHAGIVMDGVEAKFRIREGEVLVNGEVEVRRGKKIRPGDLVEFDGQVFEAVTS